MDRLIVKAPSSLCIYNPGTTRNTYKFIQRINDLCLMQNALVTIDLSEVIHITAAASVILFATVNTCQLMSGNPYKIKCIFPKNNLNIQGHTYIVKTGLAKALLAGSKDKLQDLLKSENFYQSGTNPIELLIFTMKRFGQSFTEMQFELLSTGIGEAMLNVGHHAYKKQGSKTEIDPIKQDIVESIGERWWQCAWFDDTKESWTFIICDFGLGVAQTYKRELTTVGNNLSPEEALIEAFSEGNSRFIGSGRGNGSEDMKNSVQSSAKEELLIYSSGYKYIYTSNMSQGLVQPLGYYFHGTLVQWTVYAESKGG